MSRPLEWEPPFTRVVRGCRYSAGGSLSWLGGLDRSCQLLVFGVGLWASYRAHPGRGAPLATYWPGAMPGGFRSVPLSLSPAADPSISWSLPENWRRRGLRLPGSRSSPPSLNLFLFGWVFVPF